MLFIHHRYFLVAAKRGRHLLFDGASALPLDKSLLFQLDQIPVHRGLTGVQYLHQLLYGNE